MHSLIILGGYILDLIFGDPPWPGHPTRIIGRLIETLEKKLISVKINKILSGTVLVVLVTAVTIACLWSILRLARLIHPYFYYLISALFIYFALSVKQLGIEANKVYSALKAGDLVQARKYLSMIVARDSHGLDEPEIIRATVETIAESTMDGIIAPLFYAFLGGPVLAWGYKAINTLDSMVGYRSERYIGFGRATAKLDGLINFIPAKITCFLISLSAFFYRKNWLRAARWSLRYFLKWPKDNSEATEAAMAGALGVQLGGLNFYKSIPVQRPFIGDNLYSLNAKRIPESVSLAYVSSGIFVIIGMFLLLIMGRR